MAFTDVCFCGREFSAPSLDDAVRLMTAHFAEEHASFGIGEAGVRNYLESRDRVTGATERLEQIGAVDVREVDASLVGDWVDFFDRDAFADNRGWASCYCLYHHFGAAQQDWSQRSWRDNREQMSNRLRTGEARGLLAYAGGKVAAWCNAAPRALFPDHDDGDANVGAIVCFVVAAPYRGHGVAARLLDAACESLRRMGMRVAEAYPRRDTGGWAGGAYHGPLSMYERAGFHVVGERDNVVTVRKDL